MEPVFGALSLTEKQPGRFTSGSGIKFQICAAIPDILQWIVDTLYEQYQIPKIKIYSQQREQRKNILYNICYSINATKEIYKILYY